MKSEFLRYLLALTIASTLSVLVALAIRRVVRRVFGAATAYFSWLLVPVSTFAVLLPNAPNSGSTIGISLHIDPLSALSHAIDRTLSSSLHTAPLVDWTDWALGTWVVGAALFVLYLTGLQRVFVNSLGTLSGTRCVLRAEHSGGCPALLGVLRPKIILPVDFETRYTRMERLLVLSHERTHLRRGDAAWNALVAAMRCLLWFNPLVHVAATRFREDQELSCDAAVVEDYPGLRRTYATAMLKTQLADTALPVGCHWQSKHHFKERLQMLNKPTHNLWRRRFGRVVVALTCVVVGYSAWAAEPDAIQSAVPSATASSTHELRGSRLTIMFNPGVNVTVTVDADSTNYDSEHETTIFQGHVRMKTSARAGHGTPSEQAMPTEFGNVIIEGDKVVMTRQADGGSKVEIENGSIRTFSPPSGVDVKVWRLPRKADLPASIAVDIR